MLEHAWVGTTSFKEINEPDDNRKNLSRKDCDKGRPRWSDLASEEEAESFEGSAHRSLCSLAPSGSCCRTEAANEGPGECSGARTEICKSGCHEPVLSLATSLIVLSSEVQEVASEGGVRLTLTYQRQRQDAESDA